MSKFSLGEVVATSGALEELERLEINPLELIIRHVRLDQGCLERDDHAANARAIVEGSRVFSAFKYSGVKFWVITEWDRSLTTILLPDEY